MWEKRERRERRPSQREGLPDRSSNSLKLHHHAAVDHAAREIVGHGILVAADIGDPVVAVHVADAEKIEAVHAEPHVAHGRMLLPAVVVVRRASRC